LILNTEQCVAGLLTELGSFGLLIIGQMFGSF